MLKTVFLVYSYSYYRTSELYLYKNSCSIRPQIFNLCQMQENDGGKENNADEIDRERKINKCIFFAIFFLCI